MADDIAPAPATNASDGRKMAKAAAGIGILTAAGYLTGIVMKMILSRLLGTEATANAFNYVYRLTQDIFRTWDKLLRPTFLPELAAEKKRVGEDGAWRFINSIINVQVVFLVLLAAACMFFSRPIVATLTSFGPEDEALSAKYLIALAPAILFLTLAVTGYMLLNSYKRFQLAAFGDQVFVKVVPCLALVVAWAGFKAWGRATHAPVDHVDRYIVWGLIAGIVLGAAAKLALYAWGLRGEIRRFRFEMKLNTPAMRGLGFLMLPLVAGVLVSFLRNRGEDVLLSAVLGGKAMTIVPYARAPVDIPIQLFPVALSIAIFPFLSEYFAKKQIEPLFDILAKAVRIIFLVFLPLTVAMTLLARPIVEVIFGGGKFTPADVAMTAEAVRWYALGYVFFGLEIVLLQFFYAARETWTPTWTGIVASLVNLLLLACVILWLPADDFNRAGALHMAGAFNLAYAASKALKVLLLFVLLARVYRDARLWKTMLAHALPTVGKVALATAAMGLAIRALMLVVPAGRSMKGIAGLVIVSGVGAAVFALGVHLLHIEEWHDALGWARRKLKRS